ncbi:Adenylate cyclase [Tetrabaena socialis]|uniref:Adenylate cyclase n=1 Tax=Tetrabaena socialis TaxID=47790 RepID=A0A2J8A0J0_9CHLO|nr:Adenylate cyclase [Tetrabaena socialis]|eukprot:PNH06030.1 Adenylate cyclase [Tetrabaena socialis]
MQRFSSFLSKFNIENGLRVGNKSRDPEAYAQNWVEQWPTADDPGPNDYWMVGAEAFGEDINRNAFLDLTAVAQIDPSYDISGIPVAFRDAGSSAYAGKYSSLPVWLTPYTLLYRRDVFSANNFTFPQTWDDVLLIADEYTSRSRPGQPATAFCFESNPDCGSANLMLVYILGSIVQLDGPSSGTWFDPVTLDPLYTTEAMREALRIFLALKSHSISDDTPCSDVYSMLASGQCLMLWGFSSAFKASWSGLSCWALRAAFNTSSLRGRQGVAMTPGSTLVLDRSLGKLVSCTPTLCPNAKNVTDIRTGKRVLMNQIVPLDSAAYAINARAPVHRQAAAFAMLHTFTGPEEHMKALLSPTSEVTPLRYSELEAGRWIDAGYDPSDVRSYLEVLRESFDSPNVYYELRIPGVFDINNLLDTMLQRALLGTYAHEALMAYATATTEEILQRSGGRQRLLGLYQASVGYTPPAPNVQAQGSRSTGAVLVAALVPVLATIVVLSAALWAYLHWRRVQEKNRARKDLAPGAGPGTTLFVSDIQDSTSLWEALDPAVMDAAVKVHCRIIRELLVPHNGYESMTEGDSFILAFQRQDKALSFALRAQDALLSADWPAQLMESSYAQTMYVDHRSDSVSCFMASIASQQLRDTLCLEPPGSKTTALRPQVSVASLTPCPPATWSHDVLQRSGEQPAAPLSDADDAQQPAPAASTPAGKRPSLEHRNSKGTLASALLSRVHNEGGTRRFLLAPRSSGGVLMVPPADASSVPEDAPSAQYASPSEGGESATLQEVLQRAFPEMPPQTGGEGILLFRGLRVRMGLHCGLSGPAEVQYNRASGRVTFPGPTLHLAKAVGDCGHGGQITLTTRVLRALDPKALHASSFMVLSSGHHLLKGADAPVEVHSVFAQGLVARAGYLAKLRSVEQKPLTLPPAQMPGVLQAPLGRAVVAIAQVQDADEFAGWGLESSMATHKAMLRHAGSLACAHEGYLVSTAPGSFKAIFTRPAAAVRWLLELQDQLGPAHQEEIIQAYGKDQASTHPSLSLSGTSVDTRDVANVLRRATAVARLSILSVKGGVDVGEVHASLRDSGDMVYGSGLALKRATCLAAHSNWHEVLVSLEVAAVISGQSQHTGTGRIERVQVSRPSFPGRLSMGPQTKSTTDRVQPERGQSGFALTTAEFKPIPEQQGEVLESDAAFTVTDVFAVYHDVRTIKFKRGFIEACIVKLSRAAAAERVAAQGSALTLTMLPSGHAAVGELTGLEL